jgi:hypothetical protein
MGWTISMTKFMSNIKDYFFNLFKVDITFKITVKLKFDNN